MTSQAGYIAKRIAQSIAVVWVVTIIVFALIHLLPYGPARAILGPRATPGAIRAFNVTNDYDRPLLVQYLHWFYSLMHGNLGYSVKYNQPVTTLIATYLPRSLIITVPATILALLISVPMGMYQAARRDRPIDYVLSGVSLTIYSMPVFWLGFLLILYFAIDLRILPPEAPQGTTTLSILEQPAALVLPIATLTLITIGLFSRYMRASAIEALLQDHVRTAKMKGAGPARILFRHVMRNSLVPVVTLLGLSAPGLIAGAVVTETVFNYPGMGLLLWNAALNHDFAVLLGATVLIGTVTVLASLAADLACLALDPRTASQ